MFFKGVPYANNSVIQITEIGDTILNEGLQCITDKMPCCETPPNRVGEWYFPDGMRVPMQSVGATSFYRNRRDNGAIGLHRINSNVITPTGRFCCEVPDAIDALQTVCATISNLLVSDRY